MNTSLDFLDQISVLIVGDIMLDRYLWGDVKRISPEAPVPVVEVHRETHTPGGAANVANNLLALGVKCELFGVIGNDSDGLELQSFFEKRNLRFEGRLVRSTASTITKTRIMAQRQQLCRIDRESSPNSYELAGAGILDLLAEKACTVDAVIISDYSKGAICQEVINTLKQVRAKHGTFLALDPKPQRPLDISGMDLLTPNYGEAMLLAELSVIGQTSLDDIDIASGIMARHSPACLVMTLGERGMFLRQICGASRHFPSMVRQVADVSGAGDTVISILTVAMAAGISYHTAVEIANTAAGVVVGKLGTATVTRSELNQGLQIMRDLSPPRVA